MSWWDFGEHTGYSGDLALHQITCAFCNAEGNFERVHHQEKKHPTSRKILNFDTFKCGNCGNFIMVFWSAAKFAFGPHGIHDFKTLPWARETTRFPEHWPADVGRYWLQAMRSLEGKNWDAASLMARSAIQLIARYQEAEGANLKQEIDHLADRGILPPVMKEWSHEVRDLPHQIAQYRERKGSKPSG